MKGRSAQSGFTLIELMMVVAILGVIASVAIPSFQNIAMRARAAERKAAFTSIRNAANHYFTVHDSVPGTTAVGNWNPYPAGTTPGRKLPFLTQAAGWRLLEGAMEGTVYYTYLFALLDSPGNRQLVILSDGDLDGDGVRSQKMLTYDGTAGGFHLVSEVPAPEFDGTTW